MKVNLLREPEIRQILTFAETIAVVEKCFADFSSGRAVVPGVIHLDLKEWEGEVHVKSAYLENNPYFAVKIASGFYQNPLRGLPAGNGLVLLFEAKTGLLESLMLDNGFITEMRTAAAGAVAARHLAKKKVGKVGLVGSGSQARFQIKALLEVRTPEEVWVWSRNPDHVSAYVSEMARLFPFVKFIPAPSCEEAVRESDLVVTATPSRSPLVKASWLKKGVHITAVGSDGPDKQELDVDILARADLIYCDSISQCSQLGEVHHALQEKAISQEKITGEIGEIILGRKPPRQENSQLTVADLTGLGVQDTATASLVYTRALALGIGETLET